jgi:O-antigen/teichoic acid export membrane protein
MTVHFRVDILLLSLLRAPVEVGLYDAPGKLYEIVFMLPYLFGGLLMPLFVRDLASPAASLRPRLQAAFTVVLLFGALCCAVFLVHGEEIVVLLGGEQFVASGQPLRVLGVAAALAGLCAVVRYAVTALEQQHRMLRADVISLVVAVAVHAMLIPRYGVMGAAIGRLSGDAIRTLLTMRLLRGQLGRAAWGSVGIAIAAAALFAGALLATQALGMNWMLGTALCGAAVLGACLALARLRRELAILSAS